MISQCNQRLAAAVLSPQLKINWLKYTSKTTVKWVSRLVQVRLYIQLVASYIKSKSMFKWCSATCLWSRHSATKPPRLDAKLFKLKAQIFVLGSHLRLTQRTDDTVVGWLNHVLSKTWTFCWFWFFFFFFFFLY